MVGVVYPTVRAMASGAWIATLVLVTVLSLEVWDSQAQPESTSYGRDFFIGFMRNVGGSQFVSLRLVIGTNADNANYIVRTSEETIRQGSVSSGNPVTIVVPADPRRVNLQITDSDFSNRDKGINIHSTGPEAIFAIAENFVSPFNFGVFLAYPCLTVQNGNYEYYIVSTDATSLINSQFLLVGCEDSTTFTITPTQSITIPRDLQMRNAPSETINPNTMSRDFSLGQYQTLLVRSATDLTGTKIVSNRPITVISGHECANVPSSASGCEPLAVHVPPLAYWGSSFLLASFAGRNNEQSFRAISAVETTFEYTCGTSTSQVPAKTSVDINTQSDSYCYLVSNNPILVVQFSHGGSLDNKGDPAIAMISPINQYVKEISFMTLPTREFPLNYVSVTVPEEVFNDRQIMLDGRRLVCDWEDIYDREDEVVGYGCSKAISSATSPRQHTIVHEADDGRISVLVYGFNVRQSLGYAYLTGLDLTAGNGGDPGVSIIDVPTIDFFDISAFPGVLELDRSEEDSVSDRIDIPDSLLIGNNIVSSAYVNENGVISFEKPWMFHIPENFPTSNYYSRQTLAVAPFWSDNDIRREGRVRYFSYSCNAVGFNPCVEPQEGNDALTAINDYINEVLDEDEDRFTGEWMLIAHWENVHPSPHGGDNTDNFPQEELDKVNNYQAVIVSDVLRTYAIFSYMCGEIEWSALGRNQAAVVGFNAIDSFYNHPLSGFSGIGDGVSCTRQLRRRKRQMEPFNMNLKVPVDENLRERVALCLDTYNRDRDLYTFGTDVDSLLEMLESYPCPCYRDHAREDVGRFQQQRELPNCYVSTRYVDVQLFLSRLTLTQQCCYDPNSGALQESTRNGFVGTFLLHHPHYDRNNSLERDKAFRDRCCGQIGFGVYCDKFFERRVPNTCEGYSSVGVASGSGDPHYYAFFGRYFDFQGSGDFVLLDVVSLDDELDTGDPIFSIQGRMIEQSPWIGATVHQALAIGDKDNAFQFGRLGSTEYTVFRTFPRARREDITHLLPDCGQQIADFVDGEIQLCRSGNKFQMSHYKSGVTFNATHHGRYLNFRVKVPKIYMGKIRGVVGNFEGNFIQKNGNELIFLSSQLSDQQLNDPLLTWKVLNEQSLFLNQSRRLKRQAPNFNPLFYEDLNFTEAQIMICEGIRECLYDFAITGDPEVALVTLEDQKETNETRDVLNNVPPNITATAIFRVNLNQESVLLLTVVDPGDEFSLTVTGGLPQNSVLEEIANGTFEFKWTLQEITYEALVFVANDSRGAAALFTPTIEICACVNGGNCTLDGLITNNATVLMNCECTEAFAGRFCEEDRNGCSEIQCFEGVECMDVPAPGVGAVCGSCPPGYTGDNKKCYDINECSMNATLCGQVCLNTAGSYSCACNDGYQFVGGSNQCEDVNECEGVNDCQQNCQNTMGSYVCSCNNGFTLDSDGRNCTANQPCDGACSFACAVIDQQEQCYCPTGYELSTPGGTQCVDENECIRSPCEQNCTNTDGSFVCSCRSGYQLENDGLSCEDIDECLQAALALMDVCANESNTQCVNNEGSFTCDCVPGFVPNENGTCVVIENEPPPPPPPVIRPASSTENSVNFTSPTLMIINFTPERQQKFRQVAADAVTEFCSKTICELVTNEEEKQQVIDLKVDPTNIALPSSLNFEVGGQLVFTVYVQVGDGFLSLQQLQLALIQAEEQFRTAGFLFPLPTTPPTTQPTTTEEPTTMATTTEEPTTMATTTEEPTTMATTTEEPTTMATTTEEPTTMATTTEEPTTMATTTEEPTTMATTTEEPTIMATTTEEPTTMTTTTEEPTTMATTTEEPTTMATTTEEPTTMTTTAEKPTLMATTTLEPAIEVNCEMEADRGECKATIPRFFFNPRKGVCEPFIYGGCGGNGNNFESLEECLQQCNPNNCPPYCTVEYCSSKSTRTSLCTLQNPAAVECDLKCRVTYCRVCYYDDEYRSLHQDCKTCTRTEIEQQSKCFKRWTTCIRRADGASYPKLRSRDRTQDLFKCYEHPCV